MLMYGEKFLDRTPQEEENERFLRAQKELAEITCRDLRNSGMSCRMNCIKYGTDKCLYPERVF